MFVICLNTLKKSQAMTEIKCGQIFMMVGAKHRSAFYQILSNSTVKIIPLCSD